MQICWRIKFKNEDLPPYSTNKETYFNATLECARFESNSKPRSGSFRGADSKNYNYTYKLCAISTNKNSIQFNKERFRTPYPGHKHYKWIRRFKTKNYR